MKERKLGNSGVQVAPLCLGGNVFGWTANEGVSFQLLDAFVDAGLNFIDTADAYSAWAPGHVGGESETVIGNWLKRSGKRNQVVIATKVGWEISAEKKGLKKKYILNGVEESLRRLRTDHIDVYFAHKDDPATPLVETLEALGRLVEAGKVRAIGASNYSAERLAEALALSKTQGLPRYEVLQPHYNLVERAEYEKALEPLAVKEGLGVVSYFSLAKGFLSGKYRSEADLGKSVRGGGVKGYLNERGMRIVAALDQVAKEKSSKPASVALAWLMARPSITAPIASATKLDQLHDLVEATKLELDASSIAELNEASAY